MSENGNLDKVFFDILEKYKKIYAITSDRVFKFYAPKFLEEGVYKRREQIVSEIKAIDFKLNLLDKNRFKYNFDRYEMSIAGKNWDYVDPKEMERRSRIYAFLCNNYNYQARRKTIKELSEKKEMLFAELRSLETVTSQDPRLRRMENIEYLKNLQTANEYYEYLSRELVDFANVFTTHELVVKHGLRDGVTREKFDSILEEISKLNGRRKPEDEPGDAPVQLSLF